MQYFIQVNKKCGRSSNFPPHGIINILFRRFFKGYKLHERKGNGNPCHRRQHSSPELPKINNINGNKCDRHIYKEVRYIGQQKQHVTAEPHGMAEDKDAVEQIGYRK